MSIYKKYLVIVSGGFVEFFRFTNDQDTIAKKLIKAQKR